MFGGLSDPVAEHFITQAQNRERRLAQGFGAAGHSQAHALLGALQLRQFGLGRRLGRLPSRKNASQGLDRIAGPSRGEPRPPRPGVAPAGADGAMFVAVGL